MGFRRLQFTRTPSPRPAPGGAVADLSEAADGWPCLCNYCRRIRGDSARHERARQRYIKQMQTDAEGA